MITKWKRAFERHIRADEFPCVGAKSALARGQLTIFQGAEISSATKDLDIKQALDAFGRRLATDTALLQSFVVLFAKSRAPMSERAFETALWDRIQCLHNLDVATGHDWKEGVSSDPNSPHFSMSLGEQAYFVVGLHPGASRPARRFPCPALVFNSHQQFESLRQDGLYDKMKSIVRERDEALAGEINPMLDDFGTSSEARQYSGRDTEADWRCPFEYKGNS